MIKVATLSDLQLVRDMAMKFLAVSGYQHHADIETIEGLIVDLITGDKTKGIVIVHPDGGMIAGVKSKFPFGKGFLSTEIAWWVEPELRKSGIGGNLIQYYEHWSKEIAQCFGNVMVSLDDDLGRYYEKNGYKLYERAYMKVY